MIEHAGKFIRIHILAELTSNAYQYHAYGEDNWRGCIVGLIDRGYSDERIISILRSKHMRWANDARKHNRKLANARDFFKYLDRTVIEEVLGVD